MCFLSWSLPDRHGVHVHWTDKDKEILEKVDRQAAGILTLYCFDYLENISFVYPTMSMIIIGHLLLY
jgi:hypothetical protein